MRASLTLATLMCFLLLTSSCIVHAQSYSIDWFSIDGGGGTSTGGVFGVTGTIGQPDAGGPMTGGNFSLTGGFWSLISLVQTPGAPLLTITRPSNSTVMVSGLRLRPAGSCSRTPTASPRSTGAT